MGALAPVILTEIKSIKSKTTLSKCPVGFMTDIASSKTTVQIGAEEYLRSGTAVEVSKYPDFPPELRLPVSGSTQNITLPLPANNYGMAYGDGTFIVTRRNTSSDGTMMRSTDGITWTRGHIGFNTGDSRGVMFGDSKFVHLGYNTATGYISENAGDTWEQITIPSGPWWAMTYAAGRFVAIGYSSARCITSTDGRTWTESAMPASRLWVGLAHDGEKFVTLVNSGRTVAHSVDGVTWTEHSNALPTAVNWYKVAYGNGLFVAVASGSDVYATSPDGLTWTQRTWTNRDWQQLGFGGGWFFASAVTSYTAVISQDGLTWTDITLPVSGRNHCIAYGAGRIVFLSFSTADGAVVDVADKIGSDTFIEGKYLRVK